MKLTPALAALLLATAPLFAAETRGPAEIPAVVAIPGGSVVTGELHLPPANSFGSVKAPAAPSVDPGPAGRAAPAAVAATAAPAPYFTSTLPASAAQPAGPKAAAPSRIPAADGPAAPEQAAGAQPTALGSAQAFAAEAAQERNGDNGVSPAASDATGAAGLRLFDGSRPLRVVQAAGESVPFIKTGGLADVVDAVSRGLAARGHDVTLILPKYSAIKNVPSDFKRLDAPVPVVIDNRKELAHLWVGTYEGVRVVLLENEYFFGRQGPYGSAYGDYGDNDERFMFYAHAVLAAASALNLRPDVFHVHDWQAALIPPILKLQDRHPAVAAAKTVLTLHNLAFQGLFPQWSVLKAGFSTRDFTYNKLEYWGHFGYLKSGVQYADALTTVSPTYAKQIQATNEFGMGLEGLLSFRSQDLHGILNGVDPKLWNPRTDAHLTDRYGVEDAASGKAANKARLQEHAGMARGDKPLLGVVSRLSHQKGIDMIAEVVPELVRLGFQLAITGNGDAGYEQWLKSLQQQYPDNVFVHAQFSEEMARRIYAASDFLLMPSRFEPCGLSQLMAQAYGSLPLVNPTGGLADTVKDVRDHRDGDGLHMRELSPKGLIDAAVAAMAHYNDSEALARSRRAAMTKDSSWDKAILDYEALYRRLTGV